MTVFRGLAAGVAACVLGGVLAGVPAVASTGGPPGLRADDDNGIAGQSAATIADRARTTMAAATSMRLDAQIQDSAGTTGLDLQLDVDGNCAGVVTLPAQGGKAEMIKHGKDVWMKLDDTLLKAQVPGNAGDLAAKLINHRYIHGTTDNAMLGQFTSFCDLTEFRRGFTTKPVSEQLTKGGRTTVAGAPAITVTSRHDDETGTYAVATEGKPYLLRAEVKDADGKVQTAEFRDFDQPVPTKTPAADDTIEFNDLQ
ncbi:hypothetical protein [Streptomyces sp. NPDC089919]|uniref:hypothetical protein n=1 Tax=Streptomyces sp. NPDC089919 TaxID=3155188 RepID=UPI00342814AD